MTYNDVFTGTFTGTIIGERIAKDGRRIGFIHPQNPVVREAITVLKIHAGTKKRCDGNVQFIFPVNGKNDEYSKGNASNLKDVRYVSFNVRCDDGLPQAYNVQPFEEEIEIPSIPAFEPLDVKPVESKPVEVPEELAYATGNCTAAYSAEMSKKDIEGEDVEEGCLEEEEPADFVDDGGYDEYYDYADNKRSKPRKDEDWN